MDAKPNAIEARDLTRRFGKVLAVDHLSLSVPRAQIYGFLGPNGSGKSTTIRLLCGLLRADSGSINALGLSIPKQSEQLRTRLGYMTQRFALWEDLTGRENLRFMADIHTLPRSEIVPRITELAAEYHLTGLLDRPSATLSGGQKQRLALAAATIHRPELLLLDEPTSAVDPQSRRDFWDSLFALTTSGTTILVSTHYMDEAERCHQLAILNLGRLVASGSPQALRAQLGFDVVDIETENVAAARVVLRAIPAVHSVAQLGLRLHALVDPGALALVTAALGAAALSARAQLVEPNLEDVFVVATNTAANTAANSNSASDRQRVA